jgi:hypothetical protein
MGLARPFGGEHEESLLNNFLDRLLAMKGGTPSERGIGRET